MNVGAASWLHVCWVSTVDKCRKGRWASYGCFMRQIKLTLSASFDFTQAETIIDQALGEARLTVTFKTTLRQFPGCIHWHVKRGNEKGTLEITVWPKQQRIWFSVH